MDAGSWRSFLERLSAAVLASPDLDSFDLPPAVRDAAWLGFDPVADEQIAAAEARLGVTLPPSYRAFLSVTDGWRHCGGAIERILPASEIGWLRDLHPDWIAAWRAAGDYPFDPAVDEVDYRHLDKTLAVSAIGDEAILLLNPERIGAGGEWETWFFANWVPGADAYDSFWELMQEQYTSLLAINRSQARQVRATDPPDAVVVKLPLLIEALNERLTGIRGISVHGGDMGYHAGTYDGLAEVIARVRAIPPDSEPDALRDQLRALADALVGEAATLEAEMRAQHDPTKLLGALGNLGQMLANLGSMQEGIKLGGRVQGLRSGAGVIRWFLGES